MASLFLDDTNYQLVFSNIESLAKVFAVAFTNHVANLSSVTVRDEFSM